MTKIHKLSGIVDVGGFKYEWELRSEPQWGEYEGWKGITGWCENNRYAPLLCPDLTA